MLNLFTTSVSKSIRVRLLLATFAFFIFANAGLSVRAQSTEFTYQGLVQNSGAPASGNFDFEFLLFDSLSGGLQVGSTLLRGPVLVSDGTFTVKLDFGSVFPGAIRYLEIRLRQTGQPGITILGPRQLISSTPYAIKVLRLKMPPMPHNLAE